MPLPQSTIPPLLSQTLEELGKQWAAAPERPRIAPAIQQQWDILVQAWSESDLPLAIRKQGGIRGSIVQHYSSRQFVIADNSPPQWAFSHAYDGHTYTLDEIKKLLECDEIPFAFAVSRTDRPHMHFQRTLRPRDNVNKRGWKLCHVNDVGLRTNAPLADVPLESLQQHFRALMTPSNHFLIPLEWAGLGEVPEIIAQVAAFEAAGFARVARP